MQDAPKLIINAKIDVLDPSALPPSLTAFQKTPSPTPDSTQADKEANA